MHTVLRSLQLLACATEVLEIISRRPAGQPRCRGNARAQSVQETQPSAREDRMVRPLAGVLLAFYVFQKHPIVITIPLDKAVVAWRADWQASKNLLVDDTLVGRYFFLAIFCNDRRGGWSDSANAKDGRLEPLLEDSHFCCLHGPLL